MEDNTLNIIGGGITGLATAYIAAKNGQKVRVIEGSQTFGGLLNTFEVEGTPLEFYYHHFFTHDAEINWLIKELGIQDQLIFKKTTMGVYRQGKIYDFNSPIDLFKFKPINFIDKFKFGLSSLFLGKIAQWEKYENIPAIDWFYKNAGKTSTDALWKPMLDIKFGPYAQDVPLAWMVGRMKQRLNSRNGGDERLGYLKGSLKTLLTALLNSLEQLGVELIKGQPVTKIDIQNQKIQSVTTPDHIYEGKNFVFTIPTIHLAPLLEDNAPQLFKQLQKIEYFGAVCTILEMDKPLSDIYWLNVADQGFPFGGVIEHTNFIGPENYNGKHIAYLSRYFAHNEPIARMSHEEIEKLMLQKLNNIYPKFSQNQLKKVHIFKTMTAATVCDLNFSNKIPRCKTEISGLYLAAMPHIYPDERSTNNSIRVAAETCKVLGFNKISIPEGQSMSGKIGF